MHDDYRNFYDNSPIAFWRTAIKDGQFLMGNLACAKLLGYESVDDLLKDKSTFFYVNGDRQHILDEVTAHGEINNYPVEMVLASGKHIWVSISAKGCPDKGYIEGSLVDITAEKILQDRVNIEMRALSELQKDMKEKIKEIALPAHNTSMKQ